MTGEESSMFDPGDSAAQHASKKRRMDGSPVGGKVADGKPDAFEKVPDSMDSSAVKTVGPEPELQDARHANEDAEMVDADGHAQAADTIDYTNTRAKGSPDVASTEKDNNVSMNDETNGLDISRTTEPPKHDTDDVAPPEVAPADLNSPKPSDTLPTDQDVAQRSHTTSPSATPPPPRRMTTRARALAAESNSASHSSNPTPPLSPTSTNTSLTIHPLFVVPDTAKPDRDSGLYPQEADETRRLLGLYTQKQEECVRSFEKMLRMLMKAEKMRQDVLEWCKAEGHVGEMSDGEDWYDREFWGLDDEGLRKGHDEDDEVGAQGIEEVRGKKTRRRA